jgi:hypothetical protein
VREGTTQLFHNELKLGEARNVNKATTKVAASSSRPPPLLIPEHEFIHLVNKSKDEHINPRCLNTALL